MAFDGYNYITHNARGEGAVTPVRVGGGVLFQIMNKIKHNILARVAYVLSCPLSCLYQYYAKITP